MLNTLKLFFLLSLFSSIATAEMQKPLVPNPPKLNAKSYILKDFFSRKVLVEKNADLKLSPASLTKVMTAYIVYREIKSGRLAENEEVIISKNAWRTPGSKMFIEVNKKIKVIDLIQGLVIQSGNDAAVALAEHIAGGEYTFAELMNQHADRLGMKNSNFMNSTGLPSEDHYSTARDLEILTHAMIKEFPEYYKFNSFKGFTFNGITQKNRNVLLWRDDAVDGVKTGYIKKAGYCLIASSKKEGTRLISVVLGAKTPLKRANISQALLSYGFRFYKTQKIYSENEKIAKILIYKGKEDYVDLGLGSDFYLTTSRRHFKDIKIKAIKRVKVQAPISKGMKLGVIEIMLKGQLIETIELVALKKVEIGGFFKRSYDNDGFFDVCSLAEKRPEYTDYLKRAIKEKNKIMKKIKSDLLALEAKLEKKEN